MRAIQISQVGGPEVMTLADLSVPEPKAGEAVVQIEAAGVNFIDVYVREGRYPASLPSVMGQEGAGVVTAVAADVTNVKPGDRVAYCGVLGSYAEYSAVPATPLLSFPDELVYNYAAAALLRGMSAYYLYYRTYPCGSW